jgi:ABC-type phosphate transport system substrate-binding protein
VNVIRTERTRIRWGLGLTALLGIAAALVFAAVGSAGPPAAGVGCQASDGKISGRGATFAFQAELTFMKGFRDDVCGAVGTGNFNTNGSMVIYNGQDVTGTSSGQTAPNGSGNGQKSSSCRADAFAGTDKPYNLAVLAQLDGLPGATGSCGSFTSTSNPLPPAGPYPGTSNSASNIDVMSFPIAISSVVVAAYFGGDANCPNSGNFNLTGVQVSKIFGGDLTNWNQLPGFGSCNHAIIRDVRLDDSGTTQNFKNYLSNVDPLRTGATCQGSLHWGPISDPNALVNSPPPLNNNTGWPTGTGCSTLERPGITGNPGVLDYCTGLNTGATTATPPGPGPVPGTVCYADASDVKIGGSPSGQYFPSLTIANLQNATGTAFVSPYGSGTSTNCSGAIFLPAGGDTDGSVGLNPADNWSTDQYPGNAATPGANNVTNITQNGPLYPDCGMTWMLVYTGIGEGTAGTDQPIAGLSDDQRRTLYSYVKYVLGPGQDLLSTAFYNPISPALTSTLRKGFTNNFSTAVISP